MVWLVSQGPLPVRMASQVLQVWTWLTRRYFTRPMASSAVSQAEGTFASGARSIMCCATTGSIVTLIVTGSHGAVPSRSGSTIRVGRTLGRSRHARSLA